MGKRVKKNRRVERKVVPSQSPKVTSQSPKVTSNASSEKVDDNVDDSVKVVKERRPCPHLDKSIDLDKLSTKLRSSEPIRCEDCREGGNDKRGSKGKGRAGKKKGSAADAKSESKAIWICLECGHYACAGVGLPTASNTHAIRHIRQTRHHLMIQWDNPQLRWCFPCSTFIPVENSEEDGDNKDILSQVVKLIKDRSSEPSTVDTVDVEDVWFENNSVLSTTKSEATNCLDRKGGYVVRGLVNLGNTCFFNSVMQNLLALSRLREYFFNLDSMNGQLTLSLKSLYAETKPEMGVKNVINPKSFFGFICAKAPQFRGYQQHDSHELLRCLLDGLCTEELALKKCMNTPGNNVDSANQDLTFVDAVFGGQISSTLCCVECGHSSTIYEPYLDLSLSVPTKKGPSKKAQPVSRVKKTKLPTKKLSKGRGKVSKNGDKGLSCSESPNTQHIVVPQTDSTVGSSGDSSASAVVSHDNEVNEISSTSQNLLTIAESENEQLMEKTVKENAVGADEFPWMDYLVTENMPQENAAGVDDFSWMDYLDHAAGVDEFSCMDNADPGPIAADENDFISQSKSIGLNEPLTECRQVSSHETETAHKQHDSSGNLQEEEIPLLIQESQVLLLPYREEITHAEDSVNENETFSSKVGHEQEEVEFDGFADMFNEPETAAGPISESSSVNAVAETGLLGLNISDSDPDEVDDRDSPVSIESCLAHFIKPELLSDDNAWNCENCAKTLLRQKLKAKKQSTKVVKDLVNGGESQKQCELPNLDKEITCSNGVRIINSDDNEPGDRLVSNSRIIVSCNQTSNEVENCLTGDLTLVPKCVEGKSVMEDVCLMKSNSSVSQQEEASGVQPVGSSNISQAEYCQSGESEDEEIDSKSMKVRRNAIKRVLINKAPPILTIHLKRFSQDVRGRLSKLNGHVKFRETIDLRPYVDSRCKDIDTCSYHLVGVVEHSGTMKTGHYIAYVRGGEKRNTDTETENASSSWYYVSDQHVRQVSFEQVLRSEAYILFYEKV